MPICAYYAYARADCIDRTSVTKWARDDDDSVTPVSHRLNSRVFSSTCLRVESKDGRYYATYRRSSKT